MAYPVDDTQGQGFAVESIQDSNFRSCIQIFDQCTDQKWTLICFHISDRGHREFLDGRLCRTDSEQRPIMVSNFTTVAIVKLCSHNFTQIANFMIFLCLLFLIDLLTYPY